MPMNLMHGRTKKASAFGGILLLYFFMGLAGSGFASDPQTPASPATPLKPPGFEWAAVDGRTVSLPAKKPPQFTVLCFLGAECPLAKLYGPRLQSLADSYQADEVQFVGINSNRQDSPADVLAYVKNHAITFPVVKDYDNKAADFFQATRTPEVIVLDAKGSIRYRGRIDDQYEPGIARIKPHRNDLAIALGELLAGKALTIAETEPAGCFIGKIAKTKTPTEITYAREVSRILRTHCVECHRAGEIGPFSLTEYEEVLGWGETLIEVIDAGRMPPWHANPQHGEFTNARHMPAADKNTLREWVAGGMPFGQVRDLPKPLAGVKGWQLPRKPDQIISMSQTPFAVPAEGVVEYQYFVVDPKFREDKWITAAQVIPGNSAVVHHCIVFVRPPDGTAFEGAGFLTGYVPGQRIAQLPAGRARRIPAGSRLVFQMHYTPNGKAQTDLTQIGILFGKDSEITHEVSTLTLLNRDFEIPPQAANYPASATFTRLPANGEILAITPHMHYRGKSIRVFADRNDQTQVLLDVPQYDFNWQHIYELAKPLPLADIDKLRFTVHFDNSPKNPFNPDPTAHVTWGDQTWEEMAIAFFEVSQPRGTKTDRSRKRGNQVKETPEREQKIAEFVDRYFEHFDKNRDGVIQKTELPTAQQRYGFNQFDQNGNGRLERTEIETHAAQRDF